MSATNEQIEELLKEVKDGQSVEVTFANIAASGVNFADATFFIATRRYQVSKISYVHKTKGTDSSPVSAIINKCGDVVLNASGIPLITNGSGAGFNCKANDNVVQVGTLISSPTDLILDPKDRLAIVLTGTLTALIGVVVTVTLKPL